MAVSTQVVRFTKDATNNDGATQDVNLNFTPKAIIVMSSGSTTDNTFQDGYNAIYGFSDGTTQCCVSNVSQDLAASGNTGRTHRTDSVFCQLDPTDGTTVLSRASAAFATNKVTLTWTVNDSLATYIVLVAYGGTDISNVKVATVATAVSAVGTYNYTGLGFNPEADKAVLFTLYGGATTSGALNTQVVDSCFSLGCAASSAKRWAIASDNEDVTASMDTDHYIVNDECLTGLFPDASGINFEADFNDWITDGFQLDWENLAGATTTQFSYMVIKGGIWDTGSDSIRTNAQGAGDKTHTVSVSSQTIRGLLVASCGGETAAGGFNTTLTSTARYSVGATDGTNSGDISGIDANSAADAITVQINSGARLMGYISHNTTASSSQWYWTGAFSSFGTNQFTITYASETGGGINANLFLWVVVADAIQLTSVEKSLTLRYNLEQAITKALTLRYNIEQIITKSLTLRYNLTSLLEKSLTTRYDISSLVTKTLTLLYNLEQSIEKSLTTRYDITQEIIKTLILRYDIEEAGLEEVVKTLTTRYNIEQQIEKSLTIRYDIIQEITKTLTLLYNITSLVEKSLTARYNLEQATEKSLTTRYDITSLVEKPLTLRYNLEQEITKSLTILYDIDSALTQVIKSLSLRYNLEAQIQKPLTLRYDITQKVTTVPITLRYNITALVQKTLTLRHDIRQEIEKTLTLLYDISEQITKPLTTRYDIEQTIIKVNTLRYNITALIEKALILRYNISSLVDKSLTTRYDITQKVDTVPITLRYNIAKEILKSLSLRYDIRAELIKSLSLRYDIEGALAQIIKSLTLRYNIDAQIIKTLTTRYDIVQTILKTLTMRYNITQLVPEKSITLRWDILQQIIKTLTIKHQIEASLAVLITDRGYSEPLRARIQFVARGTPATVYYTYDSFDATNRPFNVIALDIRLAQGEIGTFSLSIEDSADIVDKSKIGLGVKVIIDVKKEATGQWQRMITGFVRRIRPERPATGALIYEITGYGSQVVFNERIVNFKRAAKRTAIDSSIPLSTDKKMEAHNLFRDLVSATDILPIRKPAIQDTGNFTSLEGISSDVIDFISQIAPGLTDAASVANAISEITGAIWGTDEYGNPFFRYPTQKHSGIIIKDVPESTDSALDTSVNLAPFEFDDSIDTTEGFANRLYVLNAVSTKSTASSSGATGSTTLTTRGIAQQFTATDSNITGAAFILSKIGNPTTKDNCIFGYLRADNGGYPTGPTLASFQITFDQIETAKSTIFVNDIKPADGTIIPGNKYWWYLFSALTDDSNTVRWHHDNDLITANRISATLPLIDQDPTKPGNQLLWTRSVFGPVYSFSTFSSIRHILEHSDPESIKQYGLIEQIVDLPAFEDDRTFQKALAKIIAYSAKPKRIYQYNLVTIPTGHLFMPGQLVTVVDTKAKLTSEKNVIAEIAECTYNWDTSSNAIGCKYCDVHLIGFLDTKLDDYLDEKVC